MTTSKNAERADFYAAAVYGSIVAASLLAAFRQEHDSAKTTLGALFTTLLVFWLRHVWSTIVGERLSDGQAFTGARALAVARSEWPLMEASFVPSVALLLGWAGVFSRNLSIDIGLWFCIAQLLGWGIAVGHRAYPDRWRPALLTGLVDGALGVAIVGLELLILH